MSLQHQRGAYFISWGQGNGPGPADGVRKKVGEQIRAWNAKGVRTKLFVAARGDCHAVWSSEVGADNVCVETATTRVGRLSAIDRLRRALVAWAPAFLYLRQEDWLPPLERLVGCVPSFMELNGDDLAEARGGPLYYRLYRQLTRTRLHRRVTGFVSVSEEFARAPAFARHGHPIVVIANGIELDRFSVLPVTGDATLRFAFLGGALGAMWHGVPKIIDLARRRPDWHFEFIGPSPASLTDCPANVTAHGVLDRAVYAPILARCDVAFGTLAAHTKGLFEASPLKVRECLAYGLPIISGVRDTDFPREVPFILELPNEERNVADNIDRIEAFAKSWKGRRVPREVISHLDAKEKERRRLAFIASTLESLPRSRRRHHENP